MYSNAAKTLAMLAFEPTSRPFLQTREFAAALIELIETNLVPESARWLAHALRFTASGYGDSVELVQLGAIRALRCLHDLDGHREISACAAETIRCICAGSEAASIEFASPDLLPLLMRAVEQANAGSDAWYNAAHALFCIASAGPRPRLALNLPECVPIITALAQDAKSADLVIATITLILNDAKTRYTFANESVCAAIATIFDSNKSVSPYPSRRLP